MTTKISYTELELGIIALRADKLRQEEELKQLFREVVNDLHPSVILKSTIHKLAENKEWQIELTKAGINLGSNLIVKQLIKGHTFKRFIGAALVELASVVFINNQSATKVIAGISKLMHLNGHNTSDVEE